MGGSQKSKRVTWASDVNLCQVRLFLSEESPSQVGTGIQDHLQAKAFWQGQTGGIGSDDNLPPGFEEIQPANPWAAKLSQISLAKWKYPPRLEVNSSWRVVAGEESRETEAQNEREMRMLEAIYPRPSAIPANPTMPSDVEDSSTNEQFIPLVPITPIEDEDAGIDPDIPQPQHLSQGTFSSQGSATIHHQKDGISAAGVEPDIVAAAQAALTSVMSKGDQGSLIDRDLLIKLLSDPKMIGQLVANHAASSSIQNAPPSSVLTTPPSSSFHTMPVIGQQSVVSSTTQHMLPSSLHGMPAIGVGNSPSPSTSSILCPPSTSTPYGPNAASNRRDPIPPPVTRQELNAPPRPTPSGPFYHPNRPGTIPNIRASAPDAISIPSPSMTAAPVPRDMNYYKSLILQHGGERREPTPPQYSHPTTQLPSGTSQETPGTIKPREPKPKMSKPCIYFNTPRGCRNGANCTFLHDTNPSSSSQQRVNSSPEVQSTKRVKLDT